MTNACDIIITRGNNKGLICKNVHKWCKHKSIHCPSCKRSFRYQHSYGSHLCEGHSHKIKVNVKKKDDNHELKQLVSKLQSDIDEMKSQPKVQINNLTVISDDVFTKIMDSMGQEAGFKFLMNSIDNGPQRCMKIVDKLYLNIEDKNKYPIACRNQNHFRFLGPNYTIVDDVGGDLITKKISDSVQNAMLRASSQLIEGHVVGDTTDDLCTNYDIRRLQDKINALPMDCQSAEFKRDLAIKVSNPSHPFFQLDNEKKMS